jgi:AcrR family transcriptional regulator
LDIDIDPEHDDRRTQLLKLGLKLFGSRSYEDVSIDDIAREAGVSKGLMYHYFGGKRAFYTEVIRWTASFVENLVLPRPQLSPMENLRRGLTNYFEFVEARATAYLILMHGGLGMDDSVNTILNATRDSIVTQTIQAMEIDPSQPRIRMIVRSWVGSVEAASLEWLAQPKLPLEELVEFFTHSLSLQLTLAMPEPMRRSFIPDDKTIESLLPILRAAVDKEE